MRKAMLLAGMTLLTLVLTASAWLMFPLVSDPAFVAQAQHRGQDVLRRGQADALDPEKNGYLQPEFLPFWGRTGRERVPQSDTELVVDAWCEHASLPLAEHAALLQAGDRNYLTARKNFEKLLPALESAAGKPVFVASESQFDTDTVLINYLALRSCSLALTGLARSEVVAGSPDQAVRRLGTVFELSRSLQDHGWMLGELVAVAVGQAGVTDTFALLDPSTEVPAHRWGELARGLISSVPSKDRVLDVLLAEYAATRPSIRRFAAPSGRGLWYRVAVGPLTLREERIYDNVVTRLLQEMQKTGKLVLTSADTQPTFLDYFLGQSGRMSQLLIPDLSPMAEQLDNDRRLRTLASVAYASLAFHASKGRHARDLNELGTMFPGLDDCREPSLFYRKSPAGLTLHLPYSHAQRLADEVKEISGQANWLTADNGGLTLKL